jgi:hypothetical protein
MLLVMVAATAKVDVAALASGAAPLLEVEVLLTTWYVSVEGISVEVHLDVLLGHHLWYTVHGLVHTAKH